MNNLKVRVSSGMISLAILFSSSIGLPKKAYAADVYKKGTFIVETIGDLDSNLYYAYVVKEGDNLSSISRKICKFFNKDPEEKYWPVIAYLNNVEKYIYDGDILLFPATYERLEELLVELKQNGWTDSYIQKYNVYQPLIDIVNRVNNNTNNNTNSGNANYPMQYSMTVRELINILYSDKTTVDEEFINLVIRTLGLEGKYTSDSILKNNDEIFLFVDWIPSLEQLEEYKNPTGMSK